MENRIIEYIKDRNGNRRGVLYATCGENEDRIRIGWSYCNIKADEFNKRIGIGIAHARSTGNLKAEVPKNILYELPRFMERCRKYFQQSNPHKAIYVSGIYFGFGSDKVESTVASVIEEQKARIEELEKALEKKQLEIDEYRFMSINRDIRTYIKKLSGTLGIK